MRAWPAHLPVRIQASSYQDSRDDGLLISPTELGPAKIRRRRPALIRRRQMTLMLKADELAFWDQFLDLLLGGALNFSWQPPFDNQRETGRFLVPTGGFIVTQSATTPGDTLWSIPITIEAVP